MFFLKDLRPCVRHFLDVPAGSLAHECVVVVLRSRSTSTKRVGSFVAERMKRAPNSTDKTLCLKLREQLAVLSSGNSLCVPIMDTKMGSNSPKTQGGSSDLVHGMALPNHMMAYLFRIFLESHRKNITKLRRSDQQVFRMVEASQPTKGSNPHQEGLFPTNSFEMRSNATFHNNQRQT